MGKWDHDQWEGTKSDWLVEWGLVATEGFLDLLDLGGGDAQGFGEDVVRNAGGGAEEGTSNKR